MTAALAGSSVSTDFRQALTAEIDSQLSNNFTALGACPNAKNIIIGVISVESGQGLSWRNVNVSHTMVPATSGFGKAYESHPVIQNARKSVVINQTNLNQGRLAQSLMGCMGAYLIRGLQNGPGGFPHVQGSYGGLAESVGLLVDPGESITAKFTPDATGLRRGLVAGLCILEYNYKIYLRKYGGDKQRAIQQAVRVHLGDPNAADAVTGINSNDYLARVMNNSNEYSLSGGGTKYADLAANSVKSSTNSGRSPGKAPGCGFA